MGSAVAEPAADVRVGTTRLAAVGTVVFLGNAALLVLQLVAGRLLAPFVGSSLETWTAVIGAFLAGIAAGNALGGKLADRFPGGPWLGRALALGGLAALWMLALPALLDATELHRFLPLGVRIPVLAAALCLPAGAALSLLTPLAIRSGLPDVAHAGRVAGLIFALGTLGSLAGNYATGFVLIPNLTVNAIVLTTSGLLFVCAAATGFVRWVDPDLGAVPAPLDEEPLPAILPQANAIVFLCSFAGMTLELAAARMLAQVLGVSLYTWTGVIGVMLAGTALGNWVGGRVADRGRAGGRDRLGLWLIAAAAAGIYAVLAYIVVGYTEPFAHLGVIAQVLAWTFAVFFPAMFALGTISPQVVKLAVGDVAHAGRVAGRVYAWSTAGAIAGTFATGFVLVSGLGMYRAVVFAAVLPAIAAVIGTTVARRPGPLYVLSFVYGCTFAGFIAFTPTSTKTTRETNYYAIHAYANDNPEVRSDGGPGVAAAVAVAGPGGLFDPPGNLLTLKLDTLVHSKVRLNDPTYLHYPHEQIQLEMLRYLAATRDRGPNVLVIGGGGYTFPRCARTLVPRSAVDVVEIDPGVTAVSQSHLGLDPGLSIRSVHMDGRQFVTEAAEAGKYDLVTLDAVNDLSVPAHLLTKEFNDRVKKCLTPDGVYLLTVIDVLDRGRLTAAAVATLKETYPHVELLSASSQFAADAQAVYVIYASTVPLNLSAVRESAERAGGSPFTHRPPSDAIDSLLRQSPGMVLTDQYAPVDNLMAPVFRRRKLHD